MKYYFVGLILLFVGISVSAEKKIPSWKKGEMEIHHICTHRGESTFFIFPDGTTMLLDAGDVKTDTLPVVARQNVGKQIADYVKDVNPNGNGNVDYLVVSNFNADQIGGLDEHSQHTQGRNPDYFLTGVTQVCEYLHFKKLIDRDFPEYNYPKPNLKIEAKNYMNFVRYVTRQNGLKAEMLDVGRSDQIDLLYDKTKYHNMFRVFNLAANGNIWTGNGLNTIPVFAYKQNRQYRGDENLMSIALRINYGLFTYYTGADLSGIIANADSVVANIDAFVGKACGKVDVCKLSRGATASSNTQGFLANVKAHDYIVMPWGKEQMNKMCLDRIVGKNMVKGSRVFSSYLPENCKGGHNPYVWGEAAIPQEGNIIVKVSEKGKSYKIYVTDDNHNVLAVYKK